MKKYGARLDTVQRAGLLRVASVYKTVSTVALQVITGTIPLDLLVLERKYVHEHAGERDLAMVKLRASNTEWQSRKDNNWDKARSGGYWLSQALTGHGSFRQYLKRIGKEEDDACAYSGDTDTAEHTLFERLRLHRTRQGKEKKGRDNKQGSLRRNRQPGASDDDATRSGSRCVKEA
ncbi:hypothetical protein ILUMI_03406 [Ignelater luminosus]|uniref:Uncharacterized protein n=1 Tax=Ignelater luminosus TaxID=2038154 RepID=A0A8K0DGD9_IGNLU|nr:hypothetical protein ILUMI_03406 [Ignelater luminosus]